VDIHACTPYFLFLLLLSVLGDRPPSTSRVVVRFTMFRGPTFYTSSELAQRARYSQRVARSREAKPSDNFLVSGPNTTVTKEDPVSAYPIPEPEMLRSCGTYAMQCRAGYEEGPHESLIRKTLELQSPDGAARFELTGSGDDCTAALPGGAPIADHLLVRAEAERDWACLVPGLEFIRQNRSPSAELATHNLGITLGLSHATSFTNAISFLRKRTEEILDTYHFCQLAGDTEALGIPPAAYDDIISKPPGTEHTFRLAKRGEPARHLTTLFMFGHLGWQITIRLDIRHNQDGSRTLTPGTLQPEFWELLREVRSLTGVNISKDLDEFADLIHSLYGATGQYPAPIELSTVVRLAGFNLPRHAIQNLAWVFTGALLAKGECSAGDGRWSERWKDLPVALQCYLSGDVGQVAAIFWLATSAWLMHLFPDVHIVTLVSKMTSAPQLMNWWVDKVVHSLPAGITGKPWSPAETRADMLVGIFRNFEDREFFSFLIPGWPSPVAGGCRYLNTARSFIVDRLPQFRSLDASMWPPCYKEQYCLFLFGRRSVDPDSSPTAPAVSSSIAPNPDLEGMLRGPARSLTCGKLGDAIAPGFSLRCRILEYARAYPLEAAKFLSRLEETKEAATHMLPYDQKRYAIVWDLRDILTLLGVSLHRPSNWEDHYPLRATAERVKQLEATADLKLAGNKKKALALLHSNKRICNALLDDRKHPPPRLDLRCELKNVLHPKGPGNPSKDEELYLRIGTPIKQCPPRKLTQDASRKRPHSTSARGPGDLRDHLRQHRLDRSEGQHLLSPQPLAPSETITSGAYEASIQSQEDAVMKAPAVAPRVVHFREYQQRMESRPTSSGDTEEPPAKRHTVAAAAAFIQIQRPVPCADPVIIRPSFSSPHRPWVEPAPVATVKDKDIDGLDALLFRAKPLSVNIRRVFFVGNEQARRLTWAFAALLPQFEVRYVQVPSADLHSFNAAADELAGFDLARAYVFAWLYDERAFVQVETGSGFQISSYDNSTHCVGRVGVISRNQLLQVCDESVNLLRVVQKAVGSTLISPMPHYVVNPCCDLPNHCTDIDNISTAKLFCSDVLAMTSVVQRWVSEEGFTRTSVLCPHLELLIQLRADPWEDWIRSLRECYGREATNFSRRGYSHLAKQLWERVEEKFAEVEAFSDRSSWEGSVDERGGHLDASSSTRAQSGRRPLSRLDRTTQHQDSVRVAMYKSSNCMAEHYQSPDIEWE